VKLGSNRSNGGNVGVVLSDRVQDGLGHGRPLAHVRERLRIWQPS